MKIPSILAGALATARSAVTGHSLDGRPSLKDAAKGRFLLGVAVNEAQLNQKNGAAISLIKSQFNSITPENVMKWEVIHPDVDRYDFGPADRYVDFGEKNGMFVVGHTLVWHSQMPRWVFEDAAGKAVDRETLLARMRDHITTVVQRYRSRVDGWDVVNGVLAGDGSLLQTPWLKIIGPDYIAEAFRCAHAADPTAELYLNDYGLEDSRKREGALALIRKLRGEGIPVSGVGIQEHAGLDWPPAQLVDRTILALGGLGLKVMVTELDVDVLPTSPTHAGVAVPATRVEQSKLNPYSAGLPEPVQRHLAKRYAELFAVYLRHPSIVSRVTLWGLSDGDSWLNHWPVQGRVNHPLLFDRRCRPKPAYSAVLQTLSAVGAPSARPEGSLDL
jgi:endo-1,4-beta-xylanase